MNADRLTEIHRQGHKFNLTRRQLDGYRNADRLTDGYMNADS